MCVCVCVCLSVRVCVISEQLHQENGKSNVTFLLKCRDNSDEAK